MATAQALEKDKKVINIILAKIISVNGVDGFYHTNYLVPNNEGTCEDISCNEIGSFVHIPKDTIVILGIVNDHRLFGDSNRSCNPLAHRNLNFGHFFAFFVQSQYEKSNTLFII